MKKVLFTLGALLIGTMMQAQSRELTIQILPGSFMPVDSSAALPFVGFAHAGEQSPELSRMILFMELGEQLNLTVVNNHNEQHGFQWEVETSSVQMAPGDSALIQFSPLATGAYLFFDNLNYPFNQARGLAGAVIVTTPGDTTPNFVWFLNDHDEEWLVDLENGTPVNPETYLADYFTINGLSFPQTTTDTLASVVGQVGDPVNIWIINGGLQFHSIHFHGYHVAVLSNSGIPYPQPYSKDTFPVKPGMGLHVQLVPDQAGLFPVHDHSLTAVTAQGFYPNGMLLLLNISQ